MLTPILRTLHSIAFLLAAPLLVVGALPAAAQTFLASDNLWSNNNGWQVYRTGQLNGCMAESVQNGMVLLLGFANQEKSLVLGIGAEAIPGIEPGQTQDVVLVFDGRRTWDSQYNGFDMGGTKLLLGGYPNNGGFRRDLERSTSLSISLAGQTIAQFSLRGSSAALGDASDCFDAPANQTPQLSDADGGTIEESGDYNNRAIELYGQGRYADALPFYRRALEIRQRLLPANDPLIAQSHNNLAAGLLALGQIDEAEKNLREALKIRESALGPDHPDVAQTLNNIGALLYDKGAFAEAEPLYRRALAIREKELGPDDLLVAGTVNNLGNLMMVMKKYEAAEPLHQRALAIRLAKLGEDHEEVATSWNNLANLYQETGRLEEAGELHRKALAVREKMLGSDHPFVASSMDNLANVYWKSRKYDEAEPLYRQALARREKTYGADHPQVANNLNNLGTLLGDTGRYDEAEEVFARALSIYGDTLGEAHVRYGRTLNNYARLLGWVGRTDEGLEAARKAAAANHADRSALLVLLAAKQDAGADVLDESLRVFQQTAVSASGDALQSLAARFGAQSGELAALVRSQQDMSKELADIENAILSEIAKSNDQRDSGREAAMRERISELKQQIGDAGEQLSRDFPEFAELSRPKPLVLDDLRQLLGPDEAMIVLDVAAPDENHDYVWALGRDSGAWRQLETGAGEIAHAISVLREGLDLNNPDRKTIDPQAAHDFYNTVFAPLGEVFEDKRHLIFVLDGPASSLPPHILVTEPPTGDGLGKVQWLARNHAVTILPTVSSLQLLREAQGQAKAEKPFIGFGDPVFDPGAENGETRTASRSYAAYFRGAKTDIETLRAGLVRLPATASEVISVGESLGATSDDIVLRAAASEAAVKLARLADYNVVYFATHGLVAGEVEIVAGSGAEPALAFTIPDEATNLDDGLLTASEIAQLDLNADWVVMSACNTAAGGKPGADALSGMARAFFYAGAKSLLVSHWVVDDAATAELMKRLFSYSSDNPDERAAGALQHAMLSVMNNSAHPEWADPVYWAPFVLVGEPGRASN